MSDFDKEIMRDMAKKVDGHIAGVPFRWTNREFGWRTLSGPDHADHLIDVVKNRKYGGYEIYVGREIAGSLQDARREEDFVNLKEAMLFAAALSDWYNDRRNDRPKGYDFIG